MKKTEKIKKEVSDAQRRAVYKHDTEKVDKVTIRLPKGTKEAITAKGMTVNAFVISATVEKMEREGIHFDKNAEKNV